MRHARLLQEDLRQLQLKNSFNWRILSTRRSQTVSTEEYLQDDLRQLQLKNIYKTTSDSFNWRTSTRRPQTFSTEDYLQDDLRQFQLKNIYKTISDSFNLRISTRRCVCSHILSWEPHMSTSKCRRLHLPATHIQSSRIQNNAPETSSTSRMYLYIMQGLWMRGWPCVSESMMSK